MHAPPSSSADHVSIPCHRECNRYGKLLPSGLRRNNDLPEPEELATDAIEELEEAVLGLNKVLALLENGNGNGGAAAGKRARA